MVCELVFVDVAKKCLRRFENLGNQSPTESLEGGVDLVGQDFYARDSESV
jgi:hypothetical protein